MRHSEVRFGVWTLMLVLAGAILAPVAHADDRPNILFIFADDQCYETVHALGHDLIETPNLDRLVNEGFTFTDAYNQGSWCSPICLASRTMLNTGRFLWHARQANRLCEKERQAGRFWSEILKQAGYATYMTGKWHVNADAEKAFEFATHIRPGMPNQTPDGYNRPLLGQPDPWCPWDTKFGGFWEGGRHWSEIVGDDAEHYLSHAAGEDRPFFMYLAFNAPHDPRQSPKTYVDKYPLEKVDVPANYLDEYPYRNAIGCDDSLRDERLAPFPRTKHSVRVHRQEYYAIISHMDTQVGRILDALKKTGKADNTYVFFTADHGLAVGHHGLFGKQNMYDHSVRVPFIVVGPGVPKGASSDTPIYLQDVMPTTLELAGIDQPDHVEFSSLMPLIRGEKVTLRDAIYGGYIDLQRSVKQDGYKLILYPKIARSRLYHMTADPNEMNDLSGNAQSKPIMKKLFAKLLELQDQVGDELDLVTVYPELCAQ